jgi:hypothetical protein
MGMLHLDHVVEYEKELERVGLLKGNIRGPLLLPDYRYEKALARIHQYGKRWKLRREHTSLSMSTVKNMKFQKASPYRRRWSL